MFTHFRFILLSLLLFSLTRIDGFSRTLDSISYQTNGEGTVSLIKLSDGSTWKWRPDPYSENSLRRWAQGDPISIHAINHPGFLLENVNHPHYSPTVSLTFNSYLVYPTVASINCEAEMITLSDGSSWQAIYPFNRRTICHWEIGDRIIPINDQEFNGELINLDVPFENRLGIERFVQVSFVAGEGKPLETCDTCDTAAAVIENQEP